MSIDTFTKYKYIKKTIIKEYQHLFIVRVSTINKNKLNKKPSGPEKNICRVLCVPSLEKTSICFFLCFLYRC